MGTQSDQSPLAPPPPIGDLLPGPVLGRGRVGGIAIVGGIPRAQDYAKRAPFQGPAGQTLRQVFNRFGASRLEGIAWLTYAVPYRTPGNRPPTNEELEHYRPYLLETLHRAQPRVVLMVGGPASKALSRNWKLKITKERGTPVDYDDLLCFPTVSPSYVRQNPAAYRYLYADVKEVIRLARGGATREPPEARWKLVPPRLVDKVVDRILAKPGIYAADLETTGLDLHADHILELGIEITPGFVVVFAGEFSPGSPLSESLSRLCDSQNGVQLLWHNGKYDCSMSGHAGIPFQVGHDTLLLSYALNENPGGHDLKGLAEELLGAPPYDLTKWEKENMASVPPLRRRAYMAKDVVYTGAIFRDHLYPRVQSDEHLRKLYHETLIPVSNVLTHIEAAGVLIDLERLDALDEELTAERDQLTERLREVVEIPTFNPRSSKQVNEALYDTVFKLPLIRGFGRTSKALAMERLEDRLEALEGRRSPLWDRALKFVQSMRKIRKVNKLKGTYIDGIRKRLKSNGRIHTSFKQHGTSTGRLSSEKPNMHAVPREPRIRALIHAPKGRCLMEVDASQAELRMIADKSRDPRLCGIYQRGEDLHDEVVKSVIAKLMPNASYTEQRYQAKIVNFGTAFGRGEVSMARDYDLPRAHCRSLILGWHQRFPVASAWLESQAQRALSGKPMITRFGRKRRFGLIPSDRHARKHIANQGRNNDIQSEVSDWIARTAVALLPMLPKDVWIVNTVHDSLLLELPDDPKVVKQVALRAVTEMETLAKVLFDSPVPFIADAKVGPNWGYCRALPRPEQLVEMPEAALHLLGHVSPCERGEHTDTAYCERCGEPS